MVDVVCPFHVPRPPTSSQSLQATRGISQNSEDTFPRSCQANDFGIWVISSKLLFTRKACKLGFTLKLNSVKIQVLKPFKMCLHASTLWVLQWQSFTASRSLKLDLILRNIKRRKLQLWEPCTDGAERRAGVGAGALVR
jgi:hypothetical protein